MGNCIEQCDSYVSGEVSSVASCHGPYRFGTVLGSGSQAQVQACTDMRNGLEYAVKVFDRARKRSYINFQREIDICKACGVTRNTVQVLDNFEDRKHFFVIMEKYACNLHTSVKWAANGWTGHTTLEREQFQRVIRQAFAGIAHLHSVNIVHRDIKAQNFLTDRLDLRQGAFRVVLGDFGLAKPLEFGEVLYKPAGTRKYWAPELYDKRYWHSVDIFALGVLIFWAASGEFPYADEWAVRARDIFAEDALPEELEEEAVDILRLTLEKDPDKRISAKALAVQPWFERELPELEEDRLGPRAFSQGSLVPMAGDGADLKEVSEGFSGGDVCSKTEDSSDSGDESTHASFSHSSSSRQML